MSRRRKDEKHENFRPAPFELLLLRMCSPLLLSDSLSLPADLEARFRVIAVDSAGWTGANGAPKKVPTFTSPPPPKAPRKYPERVSHSSKSGLRDTFEALFKSIFRGHFPRHFRVSFFWCFRGSVSGYYVAYEGQSFEKRFYDFSNCVN